MVFKAKYDKAVLVILIITPIVMSIITALINSYTLNEFIAMVVVTCFISSFFVTTILSIRYTLTEDELIISILGVKNKIKYKSISKIEICRGPWKMESPSFQQIHLYEKEKLIATVSVEELQKFKTALKSHCNLF